MKTQQLETFLSVCETLNLTETSRRLNFAPSSITSHIKKLEEELGYDLLDRFGKQIMLTEKGKLFKEKAIHLLSLMNEAKNLEKMPDIMRIGAPESQCIYRIPEILSKFKEDYRDVKLTFSPAKSRFDIEKRIIAGDLDVGIITDFAFASEKLIVHELQSSSIALLAGPEYSLASKKQVHLAELKNEAFLVTEEGCSYRSMFESELKQASIYEPNLTEFTSIEAVKQCCKAGIGLAVLPEFTVEEEIRTNELAVVNLAVPLPAATVYLLYHKDKKLTGYMNHFIELALAGNK